MKFHEWAWGDIGRRTVCGFVRLERLNVLADLHLAPEPQRCRNCDRMRAAIGASSKPVLALEALPDGEAAALPDRDRDILEHATGWRSRWPLYRNHFCAGVGHDAWASLQALIERGFVRVSRQPSELSGGDTVFSVTARGIAALDRNRMGSRRASRRAASGEQTSEGGEQ